MNLQSPANKRVQHVGLKCDNVVEEVARYNRGLERKGKGQRVRELREEKGWMAERLGGGLWRVYVR